ncbi:unnamed protein product [Ceratitis capitata]|uniref:(Mediterranean fruit fly) hypothetical protein n=1 Tax=Ceratitis capitata TaxID=7213 RepID=A0A811UTU4_CERCA|nr:unnamed protein product [Ceratitis capitata]
MPVPSNVSPPLNPVIVLSRKINVLQDEDKIENLKTRREIQSLHQKNMDYEEARRRIFCDELVWDNRFFAKTTIGGRDAIALLDSGAGASCLGKNSKKLLEAKQHFIIRITGQVIRTVNGGRTAVVGGITLPVLWNNTMKDLEFLTVSELQQEVY